MTGGAQYVSQQDSAPAHAAKKSQELCEASLDMVWTKEFGPPNSADLNPLDDYVWGAFKMFTNQRPHNKKA